MRKTRKDYHYTESENCSVPSTQDIPEQFSLQDFLGCCGYNYEGKFIEFDLYNSWPEDKEEFADTRAKREDLMFLRYSTRTTRCGKLIPVIAIQPEKGKLYFPEDLSNDRGVNLAYLTLLKR